MNRTSRQYVRPALGRFSGNVSENRKNVRKSGLVYVKRTTWQAFNSQMCFFRNQASTRMRAEGDPPNFGSFHLSCGTSPFFSGNSASTTDSPWDFVI
ncbi:hypothetical protein GC163_04425 [bacterium]|nr:hypothetical protein [bacterium]